MKFKGPALGQKEQNRMASGGEYLVRFQGGDLPLLSTGEGIQVGPWYQQGFHSQNPHGYQNPWMIKPTDFGFPKPPEPNWCCIPVASGGSSEAWGCLPSPQKAF